MTPVIDPIKAVKVLAVLLAMACVWYLSWSRSHAFEIIEQQRMVIAGYESQALAMRADAERKSAAYVEAKRKADNDARDLRGRIEWLRGQTGKGCDSAARVIHEYRARRP